MENFLSITAMLGGLAFFLFGMNILGSRLEKLAGGKMEVALERLTSNLFKSLLLGIVVTAAIQSSSATTVIVVGLVNAGILKLHNAVGVIMGANIGTTVTSLILSLGDLDGSGTAGTVMTILKPSTLTPVIALIGIVILMSGKKSQTKLVGEILLGFGILFNGMFIMTDAVEPLADSPAFQTLFATLSNPVLGVLAGAAVTAIIQSSSASVGILQAVASTGAIRFSAALPIIMGQNIGTCVTALISSIGVSRGAKRVSVIHIAFNIIGTALGLIVFCGGDLLFHFPFMDSAVGAVGVALCHTVFNVCTTALLLPFSRQLEWLARAAVKEEDKTPQFAFLDPLLLRTPGAAVSECAAMTCEMGALARKSLLASLGQLSKYNGNLEAELLENEDKLDVYEDRLSGYLVQISQHGLSMEDIHTVSRLLHAIGDFERIGDHALNIQESARELHEKGLSFSGAAEAELQVLERALEDILTASVDCFQADDPAAAKLVEPLEETIDRLTDEIRARHIHRLQSGECTIQLGFILNDLLTNLERVSDHCSNIAVCVIEEREDHGEQRHAYLQDFKAAGEFAESLDKDLEKYRLP